MVVQVRFCCQISLGQIRFCQMNYEGLSGFYLFIYFLCFFKNYYYYFLLYWIFSYIEMK